MAIEETAQAPRYPVRLEVEYPPSQSRWSALFRLFLAIPVLIFVALLSGGGGGAGEATQRGGELAAAGTSGVIVAIWVTIVLRQRIPRWLFDFQAWVNRFTARAFGYLALLTDEYPAFEADYPVRYEIDYPERLSRWKVFFWKIITSIPHLFVLVVLYVTLVVVVPIAWFAILLTGRYPAGLHTYVVGVMRWGARVQAYVLSLTDEFPPFSLAADARPASKRSYMLAAAGGAGIAGLMTAGIVAVFVVLATESQHVETEVSYERLVSGELGPRGARAEVHSGQMDLLAVLDPADDRYAFLLLESGARLVEFRLRILNWRGGGEVPIRDSRFQLVDTNGEKHKARLVTGDGAEIAPFDIDSGDFTSVAVLFEVPAGVDPAELQYDVLEYVGPFGEQIDWHFQ